MAVKDEAKNSQINSTGSNTINIIDNSTSIHNHIESNYTPDKTNQSLRQERAALISGIFAVIVALISFAGVVIPLLFNADSLNDGSAHDDMSHSNPVLVTEAASTPDSSPEIIVDEQEVPPVRPVLTGEYIYSDNPQDSSVYNSEEFAKIISAINNGDIQAEEYFQLGNRIVIAPIKGTVSDRYIEFQLVAFEHFRLADNSGMAKTTWLMVNLLDDSEREMNYTESNAGGWGGSELRRWLNEDFYRALPSNWKDLIKQVQVKSLPASVSSDFLFIPSSGEVCAEWLIDSLYAEEIDKEADEITFTNFNNQTSRVKRRNGDVRWWWVRSPYDKDLFVYVSGNGQTQYAAKATMKMGICICLCM